MPSGPVIILTLKLAVVAVTFILLAALVALVRGNYRLHGRLNLLFFILTVSAVLGFETLLQLGADVKSHMTAAERLALQVHLCFAGPLPVVMGVMLYTGLKHYRRAHLLLSILFAILWIGTFITGVVFQPHAAGD